MITLTINNPEIEKVFYEDFNGDNDSFIEFISQNVIANNIEYELDAQTIEKLYDEGIASGDSGLSHDEIFQHLRDKYDIDKIQ